MVRNLVKTCDQSKINKFAGILVVRNRHCVLYNMDGKDIGKTQEYSIATIKDLKEGNTLEVGTKELEVKTIFSLHGFAFNHDNFFSQIVKQIETEEYTSGRVFAQTTAKTGLINSNFIFHFSKFDRNRKTAKKEVVLGKAPPKERISSIKSAKAKACLKPLYDPNVEGSIVLYDASKSELNSELVHLFLYIYPPSLTLCTNRGKPHCSVVIDPYLGKYGNLSFLNFHFQSFSSVPRQKIASSSGRRCPILV